MNQNQNSSDEKNDRELMIVPLEPNDGTFTQPHPWNEDLKKKQDELKRIEKELEDLIRERINVPETRH